jgi:hypothetical protein
LIFQLKSTYAFRPFDFYGTGGKIVTWIWDQICKHLKELHHASHGLDVNGGATLLYITVSSTRNTNCHVISFNIKISE